MLKIALTGSHGVGKTTLINALVPELARFGRVSICREAPRLITEKSDDPGFFRRGANTFARQSLLFVEHLIEDRRAEIGADLVLSDRTLVDHLAYTQALFPAEVPTVEFQAYQRLAFEAIGHYDEIFFVPIEFHPIDDGVREDDIAFQRQIEEGLINLYKAAGKVPVSVSGSVMQRVRPIVAFVAGAYIQQGRRETPE